LASALIDGSRIWTTDLALAAAAEVLGVSYPDDPS
jgi:hypothetical protein